MLSPCRAQLENSIVFTVFVHTVRTQRFNDPFNVFVHAVHRSETRLLTTGSALYESQRFDVLPMSVSVQCRNLLCLFRHRLSQAKRLLKSMLVSTWHSLGAPFGANPSRPCSRACSLHVRSCHKNTHRCLDISDQSIPSTKFESWYDSVSGNVQISGFPVRNLYTSNQMVSSTNLKRWSELSSKTLQISWFLLRFLRIVLISHRKHFGSYGSWHDS